MHRQVFWGVALLLAGFLLLGANFGLLRPFNLFDLWPLVFVWVSLRLISGRTFLRGDRGRSLRRAGLSSSLGAQVIGWWLLLGALVQLLHNISLSPFDWGDVFRVTLPLLLVGIGLGLMLRSRDRARRWSHKGVLEGRLSTVSSFVGDLRFGSRSWVFKSPMKVDLWAGDIDMDLTTAQFGPGDNYLAVHAWVGDVDIRAPEGLEVTAEAHASAGELSVFGERREGLGLELTGSRPALEGAGEARAASLEGPGENGAGGAAAGPRLHIDVDVTLGNIDIK